MRTHYLLLGPFISCMLLEWACVVAQNKSTDDDRITFEDEFQALLEAKRKGVKNKTEEHQISDEIFINGQYVRDKGFWNRIKNKDREGKPGAKPAPAQEGWLSHPGKTNFHGGTGKGRVNCKKEAGSEPGSEIALGEWYPPLETSLILPPSVQYHPQHRKKEGIHPDFPFPFRKRRRRQINRVGRPEEGSLSFPGAVFTGRRPSAARPDQRCITNCPTTPEYNPVCGDDLVTYTNPGKLSCTLRCGKRVRRQPGSYGTQKIV